MWKKSSKSQFKGKSYNQFNNNGNFAHFDSFLLKTEAEKTIYGQSKS